MPNTSALPVFTGSKYFANIVNRPLLNMLPILHINAFRICPISTYLVGNNENYVDLAVSYFNRRAGNIFTLEVVRNITKHMSESYKFVQSVI